ncbi:hypothetical protein BJV77DRAFT_1029354 [Russula vinacea]|nr:hypothetical protein BJV77DRAFT_1029354 [Russula vinacea]
MFLSLIFATAMGETRRWMNFVTWLSVFYTSAAFQRSKGRRNPPIIGQERRYCAANPWGQKRSPAISPHSRKPQL